MNKTQAAHDLALGQELPPLDLKITPTLVAGGALASRDYTPVHHDRDAAIAVTKSSFTQPITS